METSPVTENEFTYRRAKLTDLDQLFGLWWEMQTSHNEFDGTWYAPKKKEESKPIWMKHWRTAIRDSNFLIFVAIHKFKIIGMVKASFGDRPRLLKHQMKVIAVENAVVTRKFRRHGVFRKLMELVTDEGKLKGAKAVKLSVFNSNPAQLAYQRLGFKRHELGLIKYL
jgi:ribosomal protein S18 acetylase RimI-like enzyme